MADDYYPYDLMAGGTNPCQPWEQDERAFYGALKASNNAAYTCLLLRMHNLFVPWACGRGGSVEEAVGVLHECLAIFIVNINDGRYTFQEKARITTYLFGICKRQWFTYVNERRDRREDPFESERVRYDDETGDDVTEELMTRLIATDADEYTEKAEWVVRLEKAMALLSEDCQKLLWWFYVDELSLREIADRLGIGEGSAPVKRFRCAEQLARHYRKL